MAKMIQRGVNIYIDQQDAQRAIEALQLRFDKLNAKLKDLENTGKKGNAEWKRTEQSLKKTDISLKEVSTEIKVTEMSMSQLRAVSARLQNQLNKAKPNTPEYERFSKALAETRVEMTRLNSKQRDTENAMMKLNGVTREQDSSLTKLSKSFSKYQSIALGFIASITGISYAAKRATEEYTKLEDVFADVRKTTGLAIEEVKELDESLKAYDTRTSRDELLKLATEAGKLGITGKEAIEEFVKGGDKIRVALGEDLGEDAILNIGKLASVFGLVDTLGWEGSFNAVGSAINELGQSSSASESYLVQFASRLGGVGAMARISVQDILGYASALDQAGMNVEMSSSAVQQFITKMMADPAKFAKIAGLEVKSFTELISKDTNAAILKMLEAMKAKGGFDSMIPMFAEMGTEGIRAISVLSSLANGLENVKEAQDVSNNSFAQGVSILDEYNIKNENDQAELDKRKKRILEYTVALGEKLYPITKGVITATGSFLKLLVFLADNFKIITFALGGLTASYIAYNAQMIKTNILHAAWIVRAKLRLILMGSERTAITLATAAQRLWNNAIKANPLGFLIGLLTVAISAISIFNKKQKETTDNQNKTNLELEDNLTLLESLQAKWRILGNDLDKRKKFITDNKDAFEKLGVSINSVAEAENLLVNNTDAFVGSLMKRSLISAYKEEMNEISKELAKIKIEEEKLKEKSGSNVFGKAVLSPGINYQDFDNSGLETYNTELERLSKIAFKTEQDIDNMFNKSGFKKIENNLNTETTPPKPLDKDKKPWEKEIKTLEVGLNRSKAINEKALLEKIITEEQYNRMNLENDLKFHNDKLNILKKYKQNTGEVELDIAKTKTNQDKLTYNQEIDELQEHKDNYLLELEKRYYIGLIDQERYNFESLALDISILEKRKDIMKQYGDNTINIEREILQKRRDLWNAFKIEDEKEVEDVNENPTLEEDIKLKIQEAKLKDQYQKNLINKKEYEEAMGEIARKRWEIEYGYLENFFRKQAELTQTSLEVTGNFKEAELIKSEAKYDKEEEALKSQFDRGIISQEEYNEKKTQLEEKQQEEQKQIKKKYAGVELAINIAKIIADTAQSVMSSIAASPLTFGLPWSAVAAVTGASQLALATAQYNQIQGLEQGLYPTVTRQQDGRKFRVNSFGSVQTGIYSKPSVLVGEAGPELVVDNKRFNRIMNENPEVINYIVNGFEKGKYPNISKQALGVGRGNMDKQLIATMAELQRAINGSDIFVLRRKLRKADKTIDSINNKFN